MNKASFCAGLLVLSALVSACDESEDDPCPRIKATGSALTAVVVVGGAPVASGGAITSGTYHLTKLEVVLRPDASTDAKVQCNALAMGSRKETLRFSANSPTAGSVVGAVTSIDGSGVSFEKLAQGQYTLAATQLTMTLSGTACDTERTPLADGGSAEQRLVEDADATSHALSYSSTESTLSLMEPALVTNGTPDCHLVSTYSKD